MEIYGNIWKYMETYGNIWKYMETYGNIWRCGLLIGAIRPPAFPLPRTVELFQAWWTINFSHSDLAAYWDNMAGIPIITPGARAALFHFLRSLM